MQNWYQISFFFPYKLDSDYKEKLDIILHM
jgi:hypothetical protein